MSEEIRSRRRKFQSIDFCVMLLKSISKNKEKATAATLRVRLAAADRLLNIDGILDVPLSSEDTVSALGNPNYKEVDTDPTDAKPTAPAVASLFEQLKAERAK